MYGAPQTIFSFFDNQNDMFAVARSRYFLPIKAIRTHYHLGILINIEPWRKIILPSYNDYLWFKNNNCELSSELQFHMAFLVVNQK